MDKNHQSESVARIDLDSVGARRIGCGLNGGNEPQDSICQSTCSYVTVTMLEAHY
jgi:hypothetical protein